MFKLSEVRKLNQFHLFISPDKDKPQIIFSGWTKDGLHTIDYSTSDPESLLGEVASTNKWVKAIFSIAGDAVLGTNVPALDIAKKNLFGGSKPLKFSFDVYLFFTGEKSYEDEILKPLQALLQNYLPTSNNDNIAGKIIGKFKDYSDKKAQEAAGEDAAEGNTNSSGGIWDLSYKVFAYFKNYIGEVNTLQLPPIYDPNNSKKLGIIIGTENHWTFKANELQWTKFNVTFPPLVYSDEVGMGIFDHIKLHMEFETLRNATTQVADPLKMFHNANFGNGIQVPDNAVSFM